MFAHPDGAAADASQSPSAPQAASVADVPWLAAISALRDTPQLRGSAGLEAVEQALHWAAGRLEIRPHINSPIAFEHKQAHLAKVDALAAQRDSVFKVALLQALHPISGKPQPPLGGSAGWRCCSGWRVACTPCRLG